jgi:hypothetical protein
VFLIRLSHGDLPRYFSVTSDIRVAAGQENQRLWSKVSGRHPIGRLARCGVNEKPLCVGFGSFAMASLVENPMVETKLRGLWLLRNFTSVNTSDDR